MNSTAQRMDTLARLAGQQGQYGGQYRLWLDAAAPADVSPSQLTVTPQLDCHCVQLDYTWVAEGEPAQGRLLLACDQEAGLYTAAWMDTWHQSRRLLFCEGKAGDDNVIRVTGHFSVGEGPDWGWRTEIELLPNGLTMRAFNIHPDGEEDRAVEADYRKV